MDIVIKFDPTNQEFNIYESTTKTLLKSNSISEGLINLNLFLKNSKLLKEDSDLLSLNDTNYHLDSTAMKEIITGNMKLLKRLQNDQSEFKKSSNRFNGDSSGSGYKKKTDFTHGSRSFSKGFFSGSSGFSESNKKWGYKGGFK